MTALDGLIELVVSNERIAAPIIAFLAAWVLYGILGKRLLGADDDFWPAIRGWLLPKLDKLGAGSSLYAEGQMHSDEYIGTIQMNLDEFEESLYKYGFYRNPLAAYKTSPEGHKADGSWARRYGAVRVWGDQIRLTSYSLKELPIDSTNIPGWVFSALGRFLQSLGDILARRQLHVTLFEVDGEVRLYGHDEPNALNPLTAWKHYRAKTFDPERGVQTMRKELQAMNIDYTTEQ